MFMVFEILEFVELLFVETLAWTDFVKQTIPSDLYSSDFPAHYVIL